MDLGHHLKRARESKRISQQEIADQLGISQKTLSNIESNKAQPSVIQLAEMGKIYGVDMGLLLAKIGVHLSPPPQKILMRSKKS